MEVWRNGSVKHRLNLPEQQRGSTTTFSSVLLLPEVPDPLFVSILDLLLYLIMILFTVSSLSVYICVRGRSCGALVWTQEKCVFGTLKTLANRFTVWLYRTALDVTARSKLKTRLIYSANKHTDKNHKSPTNVL